MFAFAYQMFIVTLLLIVKSEKAPMPLAKKNNFDELIDNVYQTHCSLQQNVLENFMKRELNQ